MAPSMMICLRSPVRCPLLGEFFIATLCAADISSMNSLKDFSRGSDFGTFACERGRRGEYFCSLRSLFEGNVVLVMNSLE